MSPADAQPTQPSFVFGLGWYIPRPSSNGWWRSPYGSRIFCLGRHKSGASSFWRTCNIGPSWKPGQNITCSWLLRIAGSFFFRRDGEHGVSSRVENDVRWLVAGVREHKKRCGLQHNCATCATQLSLYMRHDLPRKPTVKGPRRERSQWQGMNRTERSTKCNNSVKATGSTEPTSENETKKETQHDKAKH